MDNIDAEEIFRIQQAITSPVLREDELTESMSVTVNDGMYETSTSFASFGADAGESSMSMSMRAGTAGTAFTGAPSTANVPSTAKTGLPPGTAGSTHMSRSLSTRAGTAASQSQTFKTSNYVGKRAKDAQVLPLSQQLAQRKQGGGAKGAAAQALLNAQKEAVSRVQTAAAQPVGMPVGSPHLRSETATASGGQRAGGPQPLSAAETEVVPSSAAS